MPWLQLKTRDRRAECTTRLVCLRKRWSVSRGRHEGSRVYVNEGLPAKGTFSIGANTWMAAEAPVCIDERRREVSSRVRSSADRLSAQPVAELCSGSGSASFQRACLWREDAGLQSGASASPPGAGGRRGPGPAAVSIRAHRPCGCTGWMFLDGVMRPMVTAHIPLAPLRKGIRAVCSRGLRSCAATLSTSPHLYPAHVSQQKGLPSAQALLWRVTCPCRSQARRRRDSVALAELARRGR